MFRKLFTLHGVLVSNDVLVRLTTAFQERNIWKRRQFLQLGTRTVGFGLRARRFWRDVRADLDGARSLVCVVDFECMACPSWDADWLGI